MAIGWMVLALGLVISTAQVTPSPAPAPTPTPTPSPTPTTTLAASTTITTTTATVSGEFTDQITDDASAGDSSVSVGRQEDYAIGDSVVIDPGTTLEEQNKVTGYGSLQLESPLQYNHKKTATIIRFPAGTTTTTINYAATVVTDSLQEFVPAGSTVVNVADQSKFPKGTEVSLDVGTSVFEEAVVIDYSSLVFKDPLKYNHNKNAVIQAKVVTTTLAPPSKISYSTHRITCEGWSNDLIMMFEKAVAKAAMVTTDRAKVDLESFTIQSLPGTSYGVDDKLTIPQIQQGIADAAGVSVKDVAVTEGVKRRLSGEERRLGTQNIVLQKLYVPKGSYELAMKANEVRKKLQDATKLQGAFAKIIKGFDQKPTIPARIKAVIIAVVSVPIADTVAANKASLEAVMAGIDLAMGNSVLLGKSRKINGPTFGGSVRTTTAAPGTTTPGITQTATPKVKYAVGQQPFFSGVQTPSLLIGLFVSFAIVAVAFGAARRRRHRPTREFITVLPEAYENFPLE